MNLLLLRSSTAASVPNNGVTVLLASGALALMLLLASGMRPWPSSTPSAAAERPSVQATELTLFEQVRHQLVTGA